MCRKVYSPQAKSGGTRGPESFGSSLVTDHLTAFMTPERWQQIEQLYHSALKRKPSPAGHFPRGCLWGR